MDKKQSWSLRGGIQAAKIIQDKELYQALLNNLIIKKGGGGDPSPL